LRPCDVNSKLERDGLDTVERQVPYRLLKSYTNIGYYEKQKESKSRDGRSHFYKESELASNFKRLALDLKSRSIIYLKLRYSNFLERYLRVLKYAGLMRDKSIDVEEAIVVKKHVKPILERDIENYEKAYLENQKILKRKTDKQILMAASKWAKMDLIQKDCTWHLDRTYTRFFISGGVAYNEVQIIYPTW
jgi:hypothetical protein